MTLLAHQNVGQRARALARGREATFVTVALIALLVWLPLQTPLAVIGYQYAGIPAGGVRALLLAKDVAVAGLVVLLFLRHRSSIRFRWFDLCAAGYVAFLVIYTVVPLVAGSQLPPIAVIASFRQFLLPVELYALGRLAFAAGVQPRVLVQVVLAVSAVAAAFTVIQYIFLPPTFWQTTLNLVAFIREVQGLPNAVSLWDISILGHYGVGDGGQFARAVGPFTHPVGTAHYFVLPLLLSAAAAMWWSHHIDSYRWLAWAAAGLLFAGAVITPISRGSWLAAFAGVLVCAVIYRRKLAVSTTLAAFALLLVLVPPFSLSVQSAVSMTDASVVGHQEAVEQGIDTVARSPFGVGVGYADHFGNALAGDARDGSEGPGVGENMYLSLIVTVGPWGLAVFLLWMVGLAITIWPKAHRRDWLSTGMFAALIAFGLSAMTASPLMRFTTSATFWLLLGMVVAAGLAAGHPSERRRTLGSAR